MVTSSRRCVLVLSLLLLAAVPSFTEAFVTSRPVISTTPTTDTRLYNIFSNAFKNDESLGKPQNAGLSKGPNYNDNVTVNGRSVQGAVVGQKLTVVAARARVKIPVNCQQGDCGTCMVKFNGRKVKACQTTLPAGKATIETL
jgi:ferredoxin